MRFSPDRSLLPTLKSVLPVRLEINALYQYKTTGAVTAWKAWRKLII